MVTRVCYPIRGTTRWTTGIQVKVDYCGYKTEDDYIEE